MDTIITTD